MTIDRISSKNLPEFIKREDSPGFRFDSGPYIGKVKDNRDPTRSGRLQVWIAELGGDETDPNFWRTVSYASPYMGSTFQESYTAEQNQSGADKNSFKTVRHTYGMWFNVPDIGNWVMCLFVAGDATRGYYFASVPNQFGHHMIPAVSSSKDVDPEHIEDSKVKSLYQAGKIGPELPVVEFNENNKKVNWEQFVKEKKPLHEPQVKILIEQGLDRPKLTKSRGHITTTSQRETPSGVFGISTPGRSIAAPPPQDAKVEQRRIKTRQGGHTFVMDDGDNSDQKGKNNLTRWRSSAGHQILLDDTDNIIYIGNSNGSTWVEMTGTGHINIYSSNSVNLRTKADLNLQVDKDINMQVDGNFNLKVKKSFNIETESLVTRSNKETKIYGGTVAIGSDGTLDLNGKSSGSFTTTGPLNITAMPINLNSGRGPSITKPKDINVKNHPETKKDGSGQWIIEPNKIKSIAKIVPTHEPWERKTGSDSSASNAPPESQSTQNKDIASGNPPGDSASPTTSGSAGTSSPGQNQASQTPTRGIATESMMKDSNAPNFPNGLGGGLLSPDQAKALAVQTALSESGGKYQAENQYGFVGKYQMGAAALTDAGYIHRSAFEQYGGLGGGNRVLDDPNAWTGKDGANNKGSFLLNPNAQEKAYESYTNKNIATGLKTGYISPNDDPATVGGKVMAAHLLGVGGANKWLKTGAGQDAFGTTGGNYYNKGRAAVAKLSDTGQG